MNCHQSELELGDFVEGALPAARVEAVEAHVATCTRCQATVADFTAIRRAAKTLEAQMPAAQVWIRIADAIEQEQRSAVPAIDRVRHMPWWRLATGTLAWQPLAAAAVMLVLLAGGTWLAWHDASSGDVTGRAGLDGAEAVIDPEVQRAEQHYSSAIGDLEQVTRAEAGSLDPERMRVVQANLEVIDQAIGQSRAALQSEPASRVARESLFDALRNKVQLLLDRVALFNEMRKGNPEGAAGIMSGMNP